MAAFPCNQFDLQEPGENSEILNGIKYVRPGNGFVPAKNLHIYGKLEVNGDNAHPMYKFLKDACPSTMKVLGEKKYMNWDVIRVNDIYWNFEKFVVDRQGRPIYRVNPASWNHGAFLHPLLDEVISGTNSTDDVQPPPLNMKDVQSSSSNTTTPLSNGSSRARLAWF